MKIWLVTIGEPFPTADNPNRRLLRTALFGQHLAKCGHQVTWWCSTFDHAKKIQLFEKDQIVNWQDNLEVRFLKSRGYKKSISLSRILDHREVGNKFINQARKMPVPDVIVVSLTPPDLLMKAVTFSKETGCPVAADIRDLWPDVIPEFFPNWMKPLIKGCLMPMHVMARKALRGCSGVIGITEDFVDWAVNKAGREKGELDQEIPLTYNVNKVEEVQLEEARNFWNSKGFNKESQDFIVLYSGSLGVQPDLATAIEGTRQLNAEGFAVRLLVCGDGDFRSEFEKMAADVPQVTFAGWVDAPKILAAMELATVGLDPLPERFDFLMTINNKAIEYMCVGLPILLSPRVGLLHRFLKEHDCGKSYATGNVDEYVTRVKEMISKNEKTQQMGKNGKKIFDERFAPEKVYKRMENYLFKLKDSVRN